MPHLVFEGGIEYRRCMTELMNSSVQRYGRVVMKIEDCWLRGDGRALLVEGVVVEFSRALHPVVLVAEQKDRVSVRLWPRVPVERNEAVRRWMAMVGAILQKAGAGRVDGSTLGPEILRDAGLLL